MAVRHFPRTGPGADRVTGYRRTWPVSAKRGNATGPAHSGRDVRAHRRPVVPGRVSLSRSVRVKGAACGVRRRRRQRRCARDRPRNPQKRSGARYGTTTVATMAKTATVTAAVVTTMCVALMACRCALAAGQDVDADFYASDELTGRPPTEPQDATKTGGRQPSSDRPPSTSNIQKVTRTGKSMDAPAVNDTTASPPPYTSDLEWLLNVYNPHRWNPVRLPAASRLSVQCRDVMRVYLEALRKGSFWAAKSECISREPRRLGVSTETDRPHSPQKKRKPNDRPFRTYPPPDRRVVPSTNDRYSRG